MIYDRLNYSMIISPLWGTSETEMTQWTNGDVDWMIDDTPFVHSTQGPVQ